MERKLITGYETLVEHVLKNLTPMNYAESVRLLSLSDEVRSFGPVKQAAIELYRTRVAAASSAAPA